MTTVTGLTAARMEEIEAASVVDGNIVGDNLILERHDGATIDAGNVRGPIGPTGSGYIICTSTTRPAGLLTTDEGLAIYETDTGLRRYWTGTYWQTQERIICTSTTRPTLITEDDGVEIFETDTLKTYVWEGDSWVSQVANRELILFETTRTVDSSVITNTEHEFTPGYTRTFDLISGRRYYVEFGYRCSPSVSGTRVQFNLWDGAIVSGTRWAVAEFALHGTEWVSAKLRLLIPTGTVNLRFSAKSLTSGENFTILGDNNWPGIYQIIEVVN